MHKPFFILAFIFLLTLKGIAFGHLCDSDCPYDCVSCDDPPWTYCITPHGATNPHVCCPSKSLCCADKCCPAGSQCRKEVCMVSNKQVPSVPPLTPRAPVHNSGKGVPGKKPVVKKLTPYDIRERQQQRNQRTLIPPPSEG